MNRSPWVRATYPEGPHSAPSNAPRPPGAGAGGPPPPCHRLSQPWSIPATRGTSRGARGGRQAGVGGGQGTQTAGGSPLGSAAAVAALPSGFRPRGATRVRGSVPAPRTLLMSKGPRDSDVKTPMVTSRRSRPSPRCAVKFALWEGAATPGAVSVRDPWPPRLQGSAGRSARGFRIGCESVYYHRCYYYYYHQWYWYYYY